MNGTELVPQEHHITPGAPAPIADDALLSIADRAEQRIEAVQKIKRLALRVTSKDDWVDLGGRPYLTASGCRKVARLFGVSWQIEGPERIEYEGGHFGFRYLGSFTLGGATIEEIGERSSRDAFFSRAHKRDIPPSEIDAGNVEKAAFTNLLNRGLKSLLGLGGLTWEDLRETDVRQGGTSRVDYGAKSAPAKPPAAQTPPAAVERELSQGAKALWQDLQDYCKGDRAEIKKTLVSLTGKESLYALTPEEINAAADDLRAMKKRPPVTDSSPSWDEIGTGRGTSTEDF